MTLFRDTDFAAEPNIPVEFQESSLQHCFGFKDSSIALQYVAGCFFFFFKQLFLILNQPGIVWNLVSILFAACIISNNRHSGERTLYFETKVGTFLVNRVF